MSEVFDVRKIILPMSGFAELAKKAAADGHMFLMRMSEEWANGSNRFAQSGEMMLGVFDGTQLIAVGGLNICPYSNDLQIGRLRHLYVSGAYRNKGIASILIGKIISSANDHFIIVRLRTNNSAAIALYERYGFIYSTHPQASHEILIGRLRP